MSQREICVICQGDYIEDDGDIKILLPRGHTGHHDCLKGLYRHQKDRYIPEDLFLRARCPVCRRRIHRIDLLTES